jgi:acetoin utilization protein AcuB
MLNDRTRKTDRGKVPAPPLVRDYMSRAPVTMGRTQTLALARERMRTHDVRHLPVVEGGQLKGVLSQRDIYFAEASSRLNLDVVTVQEAMSSEAYSVSPDAPLIDVAAEMAEQKYGCAVVMQRRRVVGIFTTTDALRALVALNRAASTGRPESPAKTTKRR